ncbi:MAG: 6-bladed beta-propeller [Bacteroidetes bacterium]|jgi:hypothetical protein|nr:6-bladed beta-propeller [Bacteroidota bacterium]MBT3750676.1 6-bladed beta-propeller [Bacteroidota bacterium]MBT4401889.1 6-bladed beta-propeller [Bacteroidota bacterium]MBT4408419.1 6-bladed beta-propeller [Bacteroidota bacterium]MBT4970054.1 6-bladed beta-propeller [Bacteroidota bacterium]
MNRYASILPVLISFLICCILYSCDPLTGPQNDKFQVIKVDITETQIEKELVIKDVIPLETSDNCLIGYIKDVDLWNNRIIILDKHRSRSMFVFDTVGKLVSKTTLGKGPGEVVWPAAMSINKRDSTISMWDQGQKSIVEFDLNCNFIDSKPYPNLFMMDFFPVGIDTLLVYNIQGFTNSKGEKRLTTYSLYTEDISRAKNLEIFLEENKGAYNLMSPVDISSDQILFIAPLSYNICELIDDTYRIKYALDFGNAAISSEQWEKLSIDDLISLVHHSYENKVGSLLSVYSNKHILMITAAYGDYGITIFYSFNDKKTYSLKNYIDHGLLPPCNVWGMKENGCIYAIVDAEDFVRFNELTQRYDHLKITKNDNPILITFQIESLY